MILAVPSGPAEGGCHGAEVLDHRLLRGDVAVAERVLPLPDHDVVPVEPGVRRIGRDEDELGHVAQPQAGIRDGTATEGVARLGHAVAAGLGGLGRRHVVRCSSVGFAAPIGAGDALMVRPPGSPEMGLASRSAPGRVLRRVSCRVAA